MLYAHNVVPGDATGNILLATLASLRQAGHDARVFAPLSGVRDRAIRRADLGKVRRSRFFKAADVHLFEFGWTYELFDLLLEIEAPARTIVRFHGITPRALMPQRLQDGIDRTSTQLVNAKRADLVLGASEYAAAMLVAHGIDPARVRVLPLPVRLPIVDHRATTPGITTLLFVGRLMPSKGTLDLLTALAALRDGGTRDWRLRVVTDLASADPDYERLVRAFVGSAALAPMIDHFGGVESREELARLYASSDAVIVPTYHDTYCLPMLEGLASRCAVIAYASGAVPEVASGLARLVPTGDIAALTLEIARLFECVAARSVGIASGETIPREEFERRAHDRTRVLDGRTYDRALLAMMVEGDAGRMGRPSLTGRFASWWRSR